MFHISVILASLSTIFEIEYYINDLPENEFDMYYRKLCKDKLSKYTGLQYEGKFYLYCEDENFDLLKLCTKNDNEIYNKFYLKWICFDLESSIYDLEFYRVETTKSGKFFLKEFNDKSFDEYFYKKGVVVENFAQGEEFMKFDNDKHIIIFTDEIKKSICRAKKYILENLNVYSNKYRDLACLERSFIDKLPAMIYKKKKICKIEYLFLFLMWLIIAVCVYFIL